MSEVAINTENLSVTGTRGFLGAVEVSEVCMSPLSIGTGTLNKGPVLDGGDSDVSRSVAAHSSAIRHILSGCRKAKIAFSVVNAVVVDVVNRNTFRSLKDKAVHWYASATRSCPSDPAFGARMPKSIPLVFHEFGIVIGINDGKLPTGEGNVANRCVLWLGNLFADCMSHAASSIKICNVIPECITKGGTCA